MVTIGIALCPCDIYVPLVLKLLRYCRKSQQIRVLKC